jgi:hypothetical protein
VGKENLGKRRRRKRRRRGVSLLKTKRSSVGVKLIVVKREKLILMTSMSTMISQFQLG